MKYFLDTEFIEKPGSIQLISIGIVSENGRTFYAENTSFDEREADDWVKKNVLDKLKWWPHRAPFKRTSNIMKFEVYGHQTWIKESLLEFFKDDKQCEFWAYFADYDWVIFCWIFGRMIDLPENFSMYCRDLGQSLDEMGKMKLPEPDNEHNALADALWNKQLYEYLYNEGSSTKAA
jgi:hypothetical protein